MKIRRQAESRRRTAAISILSPYSDLLSAETKQRAGDVKRGKPAPGVVENFKLS